MALPPEWLIRDGIAGEYRGAKLGDVRRGARLCSIVERAAVAPERSFPKLAPSVAEREALYRFLRNEDVHWLEVIAPHFEASARRALECGRARVVHDTTDLVFSGDREGLGPVLKDTKGLFLHTSLLVSGGEERTPLGVIEVLPYVRARSEGMRPLNERKLAARKAPRLEKESCRWELQAQNASDRLGSRDVIHVMDQEADDFTLFAEMVERGLRFVVRGASTRLVQRESTSTQDALNATEAVVFRTVSLSKRAGGRSKKEQKAHPPRHERLAELHLRWAKLELHKPQHAQSHVESLTLNVVQVFEPNPPDGEAPTQWTLYTSESVTNQTQAELVVDDYRARWRIEEYFRALKQGCAIQKRQLESIHAILNAVAIFMPIAWRLLVLRAIAREEPNRPATLVFESEELKVIDVLLAHDGSKPLSANPTIRQAMLAVASLGGHIKNNGEPGWLTLAEGYSRLFQALPVWRAAREM